MAKERIKTSTQSYKISLDSLELLIEKIKDLTKLDNTIVMNFSNDDLLLFSLVGKNLDNIHAFKSHILKIKDVFLYTKDELPHDVRYILTDAKKFVTSLVVFHKYMVSQKINDACELKLTYNEEFCEKITISNSKSKEETPGGKPTPIHRIEVENIEEVMDTNLASYSFTLNKEDFLYIKAKTVIEKENDILYLNILDNKLSIGENRWEHNICDIEYENTTISFPKKYFKCINYDYENEMKIFVTETYLLILGATSNLLVTIELSV